MGAGRKVRNRSRDEACRPNKLISHTEKKVIYLLCKDNRPQVSLFSLTGNPLWLNIPLNFTATLPGLEKHQLMPRFISIPFMSSCIHTSGFTFREKNNTCDLQRSMN